MSACHAVLLTPSISLRLTQALSCTQIMRETPLIPFYVFNSLRTLSFSVSCNLFVCHSYENCRGVYQQFPNWNSVLSNLHSPPYSSSFFSHSCALFCTARNANTFVFKHSRTLCAKQGGGEYFSPHPEGDADPEKRSAEGPLKFCPARYAFRVSPVPALPRLSTRIHLTNKSREGTASAVPKSSGKAGVLTPEVGRAWC